MNWFDLNKELRAIRSETHQDFSDMSARSSPTVTPIIQAVYKIGQLEAYMMEISGETEQAQGILDFVEKLRILTVGNGTKT